MEASGLFGTAFSFLDGHHLDLDDEFAFSVHETREAWEEQQREYAEWSRRMDEERSPKAAPPAADDFPSVWSGVAPDDPLPGDAGGVLGLAFRLSELVADLKFRDAQPGPVSALNERFRAFRDAAPDDRSAAAAALREAVESLSSDHPDLRGKLSDFQSRLDEALRSA